MGSKQVPVTDSEKHRLFFLRTGVVIAVGLALIAFDWSTSKEVIKKMQIPESEQIGEASQINLAGISGSFKIASCQKSVQKSISREENSSRNASIDTDANSKKDKNNDILTIHDGAFACVDEMPTYPGGKKALYNYISEKVNNSNTLRIRNGSNKVLVKFVVDFNGQIRNPSIVKSASAVLDKEALRIISTLPDWIPGKHNGQNVAVWCSLPIYFK